MQEPICQREEHQTAQRFHVEVERRSHDFFFLRGHQNAVDGDQHVEWQTCKENSVQSRAKSKRFAHIETEIITGLETALVRQDFFQSNRDLC